MLTITVPAGELFDESTNTFIQTKEQTLQLEHSLVSLSKWESKYCKAFLSKKEKTAEETLDYIKFMTLTQNVKPETYLMLSQENIDAINEYIAAPMTAVYFPADNEQGKINNETVMAELIYYWMIALKIPVEFQKWHLNRLIALIKVCNIKNQPPKKGGSKAMVEQRRALNEARRKQYNTKG